MRFNHFADDVAIGQILGVVGVQAFDGGEVAGAADALGVELIAEVAVVDESAVFVGQDGPSLFDITAVVIIEPLLQGGGVAQLLFTLADVALHFEL